MKWVNDIEMRYAAASLDIITPGSENMDTPAIWLAGYLCFLQNSQCPN